MPNINFPSGAVPGTQYTQAGITWLYNGTSWTVKQCVSSAGEDGVMMMDIYDQNANGIVDNTEKLGGQLPSYYLNRSNQIGKQVAATISDFAAAVRALPGIMLTNTYDPQNTGSVANAASLGGLPASSYITLETLNTDLNSLSNLTVSGTITASSFVGNGVTPIGGIIMWSGSSAAIPAGWHICDGSTLSRTTYTALFAVISTSFGIGDGSSTFTLPNLQDRFVVGAGGAYSTGNIGGANSTTISVSNLPSHSHTITDPGHAHGINDPGHSHSVNDPGHVHFGNFAGKFSSLAWNYGDGGYGGSSGGRGLSSVGSDLPDANNEPITTTTNIGLSLTSSATGVSSRSVNTGITISSTGSGSPISFTPPYFALSYIIRVL